MQKMSVVVMLISVSLLVSCTVNEFKNSVKSAVDPITKNTRDALVSGSNTMKTNVKDHVDPVVSNSRKQLDSTVGTVKNTVKENVDPVVSNTEKALDVNGKYAK